MLTTRSRIALQDAICKALDEHGERIAKGGMKACNRNANAAKGGNHCIHAAAIMEAAEKTHEPIGGKDLNDLKRLVEGMISSFADLCQSSEPGHVKKQVEQSVVQLVFAIMTQDQKETAKAVEILDRLEKSRAN